MSSEELQTLWGRVLAGEIRSPGSCSLRTLEFLRNLSQEEALQIAKLSRFVINNDFIFRRDTRLLESEGITFVFLQYLQDLGIISGVEAVGLIYTPKSRCPDRFQCEFISYDRILLVTHEKASRKPGFEVYLLTSLGKQVLKMGSFSPHESYLRSFGGYFRDRGFDVKIAQWIQYDETRGRYYNPQELGDQC